MPWTWTTTAAAPDRGMPAVTSHRAQRYVSPEPRMDPPGHNKPLLLLVPGDAVIRTSHEHFQGMEDSPKTTSSLLSMNCVFVPGLVGL